MERKRYTIDELLAKFTESPPPENIYDKTLIKEECRYPFTEYFYKEPLNFSKKPQQPKSYTKSYNSHSKNHRASRNPKSLISEHPQPMGLSQPKVDPNSFNKGSSHNSRAPVGSLPPGFEERALKVLSKNENINENKTEQEKQNIIENNDEKIDDNNDNNENNESSENNGPEVIQPPAFAPLKLGQINDQNSNNENIKIEDNKEQNNDNNNYMAEPTFQSFDSVQSNPSSEPIFNGSQNFITMNNFTQPTYSSNEQQNGFTSVIDKKATEPEVVPPPINGLQEPTFSSFMSVQNQVESANTNNQETIPKNVDIQQHHKEIQNRSQGRYNKFAPYIPGEQKHQNKENQSHENSNKSNPFAPYVPSRSVSNSEPQKTNQTINPPQVNQSSQDTTVPPPSVQTPNPKLPPRSSSYNGITFPPQFTQMPYPQQQPQYFYPNQMQADPNIMPQNSFNYNQRMVPVSFQQPYQAQQMYQYNPQVYNQQRFYPQQQMYNLMQMQFPPQQLQQQQPQIQQPAHHLYNPYGPPQFQQISQSNPNLVPPQTAYFQNQQTMEYNEPQQQSFGFNSVIDPIRNKTQNTQPNQFQSSMQQIPMNSQEDFQPSESQPKAKKISMEFQQIDAPVSFASWDSINTTPAPDFQHLLEQEQKNTIKNPTESIETVKTSNQVPSPASFVDYNAPKSKRGNEGRRGDRRSRREKQEQAKPAPIDVNMFMTNINTVDIENRPKLEYNNGDQGLHPAHKIHAAQATPSSAPTNEAPTITQLGFASTAFASPEIVQAPQQARPVPFSEPISGHPDPSQFVTSTKAESADFSTNRRTNYNAPPRSQRRPRSNRPYY